MDEAVVRVGSKDGAADPLVAENAGALVRHDHAALAATDQLLSDLPDQARDQRQEDGEKQPLLNLSLAIAAER